MSPAAPPGKSSSAQNQPSGDGFTRPGASDSAHNAVSSFKCVGADSPPSLLHLLPGEGTSPVRILTGLEQQQVSCRAAGSRKTTEIKTPN